jgi:predicted alpha/beta-hydrolase family hydrolase
VKDYKIAVGAPRPPTARLKLSSSGSSMTSNIGSQLSDGPFMLGGAIMGGAIIGGAEKVYSNLTVILGALCY